MTREFEASWISEVPIVGGDASFPVRRIYCVGRNYAEHAREMGMDVPADADRGSPIYFTKAPDSIVPSGDEVPYPPRTENFHHEIELVVAIGEEGANIPESDALSHVLGYAVGIDLTRRDLQALGKKNGGPWDTAKAFDHAAVITPINRADDVGHPGKGRIWLSVGGDERQDGDLSEMIWNVAEVIADLSTLFRLMPGDLIYTGTPAGVGPLLPGDEVTGGIDGLEPLSVKIT